MSDNLPTIQQSIAEIAPVSIQAMKNQVQAIQQAMKDVMVRDVHFGIIPGTGDKPALLKAGAEKIGVLFRLSPTFTEVTIEGANGHREVRVTCTLTSASGLVIAQGLGSCSTMESKYRWRKGSRLCPDCGKDTIIKGKAEYGGGWLCFGKRGGCGAKFTDGDRAIEGQATERTENPDIADAYNTVLKMAKKRAHVDAIITGTAASDIFAQDIEEGYDPVVEVVPTKKVEAVETRPTPKTPIASGPINWDELKYRYHLPVKKEGKDMDKVRAWLKEKGFKFNAEDKHWYGNEYVEKIAEYLRPLEGSDIVIDPDPRPVGQTVALSEEDDDLPAWNL